MIRNQYPDEEREIRERLARIRETVREEALRAGRDEQEITIMGVTKTVPAHRVNLALTAGVTLLGENRAQELRDKFDAYDCGPEKIHFIGHLQTNKIRDIMGKVSCVQSVDSVRLAEALSQAVLNRSDSLAVFLQVNIGREETKSGFLPEEMPDALKRISELPGLRVEGLMAIPPRGAGDRYLGEMAQLRAQLAALELPGVSLSHLSMGMSEDYPLAVRWGATILRIGRGIFGERDIR
mgnify:CR=1 FL=1